MKVSTQDIARSFFLLGIRSDELDRAMSAPSFEEAQKQIEQLKDQARRNLRNKVKELHPDLHGHDEQKMQSLKELTKAADIIKHVQIESRRPPVVPSTTYIQVHINGTIINFVNTSSSTTTTTTVSGMSGFWGY